MNSIFSNLKVSPKFFISTSTVPNICWEGIRTGLKELSVHMNNEGGISITKKKCLWSFTGAQYFLDALASLESTVVGQ